MQEFDTEHSGNRKKSSECSSQNCEKAAKLIFTVIDGEASEEDVKFLRDHVEDCGSCFEKFSIEESLVKLVKNKICLKPCPQATVDSIKSKIQVEKLN